MKIRKKNLFSPVVITLEKKEEAQRLYEFIQEAFSNIPDTRKTSHKYNEARVLSGELEYALREETEE